MSALRRFASYLITLSLLSLPCNAVADTLTVAVAANFAQAFQSLARNFEQQTGHTVITSLGSTGKLYTQIRKGAPYDLFLAADSERPALLEQAGLAERRITYAVGRLTLWRSNNGPIEDGTVVLQQGEFRFLAIANPKTAPYGRAAQQALEAMGIWTRLKDRTVRGENITQAYQYVASGNAELGLVALSHVIDTHKVGGHYWLVPQHMHQAIEQQAVLLVRSREKKAARQMMDYLGSEEAQWLIKRFGYSASS